MLTSSLQTQWKKAILSPLTILGQETRFAYSIRFPIPCTVWRRSLTDNAAQRMDLRIDSDCPSSVYPHVHISGDVYRRFCNDDVISVRTFVPSSLLSKCPAQTAVYPERYLENLAVLWRPHNRNKTLIQKLWSSRETFLLFQTCSFAYDSAFHFTYATAVQLNAMLCRSEGVARKRLYLI